MLTKTKIILAATLLLGTASAALASDHEDQSGGFVMPGSMDGVNPVYHPGIFGNPAAARAYGFVSSSKAGAAYGFVPSTTQHKHRSPR
jgi:hypothetical protein